VDAFVICGKKRVLLASVGQPQNTKTLNKCRGATALKVTEGNVKQELVSGSAVALKLSSFYLAMQQCSSADRSILFPTCVVRSVEHNKERFKCFPKAN
jgi:hypothetical protein